MIVNTLKQKSLLFILHLHPHNPPPKKEKEVITMQIQQTLDVRQVYFLGYLGSTTRANLCHFSRICVTLSGFYCILQLHHPLLKG